MPKGFGCLSSSDPNTPHPPQTNIKNFKAFPSISLGYKSHILTKKTKTQKNTSTFAKRTNIIWMLGNQLKMWVFMDLLIELHPFKPTSLPLPVTVGSAPCHTFRCSASLKRTPDKLEVETSNKLKWKKATEIGSLKYRDHSLDEYFTEVGILSLSKSILKFTKNDPTITILLNSVDQFWRI